MSQPPPHQRLARAAAAFWRGRIERHGRGGWTLIVLLAVVALAALLFLTAGNSPWDRGIPDKLANKHELTIRDTIAAGLWLGAAINLGLATVLLLLSRWWARPIEAKPIAAHVIPVAKGARWFWALTLLAVVVAGALRAPRLTHSFWNDEEQAFRKFTWGEYETQKKGGDALEFDPAGWDRALFYSVNGNNHVLHTVAAKLCHSAWKMIARPERETFREWVIRLEPFACGLLVLLAVAVWLRRAGFPVAGVAAAWILALHPWVMRYAVEARGYAALLFCIVLTLSCATEALRTGQWRWWIGYGFGQCAYLLCFAGAVYLAVAMNAILAATFAIRRDQTALWRWLVACTLGAMVFLQMMTATVLRIWNWIQAPHLEPFPVDAAYARDFWAHLVLGVPWAGPDPAKHLGTSIAQLADGDPLWGTVFQWGVPILLVLGSVAASLRCREARFFLGTLALTAGLILLHNLVSDLTFFAWYALYFTLGFSIALGFVAEVWSRAPGRVRHAITVSVVILFAWLAHRPLATIRSHDRHPMRQAVAAARGESPAIAAHHAAHLTAAVGSGANQIRTYDPRVLWIKTAADLETAAKTSRESGKPFTVYACGPAKLRQDHPDLAAILDDPTRFEPGPYLPGQEEFWSFQLYHLKPDRD